MKTNRVWVWVLIVSCLCAGGLVAQQTDSNSATSANNLPAASQPVPRLIMFSGTLKDLTGEPLTGPVDLSFAIYKEQTAAEPLWQETQTLNLDEQGHYTVLLGAMQQEGLPVELFTTGEARWLGVAAGKLPEQPRTMLVSVPYALEANDAQMLGGKPASAFMLAPQAGTNGTTTSLGTLPLTAETLPATPGSGKESPQAITTGGTANYLAGWVNSSTLGTSAIYQDPTTNYIGIGTTSPGFTLDVVGHGGGSGTYISVGDYVGANTYGFAQGSYQLRNSNYQSGAGQEIFAFGAEGKLSNAGVVTSSDFYIWDDLAAGGNGSNKAVFQSGLGKIAFGNAITDTTNLTNAALVIDSSNRVGIGTTTPAHVLDVAGDINASSNITSGGTVTATSFSGSGSGLTALNASNLSSGTVPSARISGTYSNALTLSSASNSFTGNGSGLTNVSAATATTATNALALGGLASSAYEQVANKNAASGYAGLDSSSRLTKAQAPAATAYTDASNTFTTGTQDLSGAAATLPVKSVLSANTPSSCVANKELLIKTDATAGQQLFICNSSGTGWNLAGDGTSAGGVTSFNSRTGAVLPATNDYAFNQISGTVGATQLSGTYSNALTFSSASNSFTGSGAGLTGLSASNLGSGTLPDARLSGTYTGALTLSSTSNSFSGSGAGLTALSASNLGSGTLPDARLSGTYTGALTLSNASNSFTGSGTGLTALNASNLSSGTVPSARISGTYSSAVTFSSASNSFTGDGTGLTNVNAATATSATTAATATNALALGGMASSAFEQVANKNAASGYAGLDGSSRIAKAQAPSATAYKDASNAFTTGTQDLSAATATLPVKSVLSASAPSSCTTNKELLIKTDATAGQQLFICNGSGNGWNLVGDGSGGAGVTSFNSRTGAVLPATNDYAFNQISGTVGSTQLSGTYSSALTLSNASNSFTGSGAGLSSVNADMLDGLHASSFATLAGNTFTASQSIQGSLTATASASGATAVYGQATNVASANTGVHGRADGDGGAGVYGEAHNGTSAAGVWGYSTSGLAGDFSGNVNVSGNISKAGGSFKIDHPLDPANKYLSHSFVESPDMKNVYDGIATLDDKGEATVELPEWFEALNRDFRYQLTAVGGPAPALHIASKIAQNQFKIAGGTAGLEVSWQVTGIRKDAWANAHRIPVESEKSAKERGYYLHPDLYGASEEKGMGWAHHPELMEKMGEGKAQPK